MIQELVSALKKDKLRNVSLLNFCKSYTIDKYQIVGNSVLMFGRSDEDWVYLSCDSDDELRDLVSYLLSSDRFFAAIEDWMIPYICEAKDILWRLRCVRLYLPEEIVLPDTTTEIVELNENDAEWIYNNSDYKEYTGFEYIVTRIQYGIGLGIRKDNKLVAWVMTHDDGAIGFLHVMPDYRRKGYAKELMCAISARVREADEIPFLHIEEDNYQSLSLMKKIGYKEDRVVNWFERNIK